MTSPKIETIGGFTLNLADIKCIKPGPDDDSRNMLIFQFKTRYDYIKNPETQEYEKREYNECAEVEFYSYDSLVAHSNEWIVAWTPYLKSVE